MAAEYILKEGNPNVMLCERGIRTFETAYRFTLDLMAVPVLKELTHLPVIVDPSHAAGRRDLVAAAVARRGRRRRRRDHRRGPPQPRRGDLRRPAGAARGRLRRLRAAVEHAAALAGKALSASDAWTAVEGRGPRGRADRRLDRPGRAPRADARYAGYDPDPRVRAQGARAGRDRHAGAGHRHRARGRRRRVRRRARRRAAPRPSAALASAGPDCVVSDVGSTKRVARRRAAPTSVSSAVTRWQAPRPPAWSTRARTSSTARPGI